MLVRFRLQYRFVSALTPFMSKRFCHESNNGSVMKGIVIHEAPSKHCGNVQVLRHKIDGKELLEMSFLSSNNKHDNKIQTLSMSNAPEKLLLPYMFDLMSATCFLPLDTPPRNILLMGLGGATAYHYLRHYYNKSHIHVVEYDPTVIDVAQKYFHFPQPRKDPLTTLYVSDGKDFVTSLVDNNNLETNESITFDLIIQNAVASIPSPLLSTEGFTNFLSLLNDHGVFIQNLFCRDSPQKSAIENAAKVFSSGLYLSYSEANIIFAAVKMPPSEPDPVWRPLTKVEKLAGKELPIEDYRHSHIPEQVAQDISFDHPIPMEEIEMRAVTAWDNGFMDLEILPNVRNFVYRSPDS